MSDRIPILQIPRALSATEKRVYDRLRSGDTPDRICMEMHLYPDRYAELVQSIRSKGHNPDQKEVEKMEWTAEEKRILIQMKKEGATNAQIAEKLGRNKGQVAVKYSTMMKSAQRDPETSAPLLRHLPLIPFWNQLQMCQSLIRYTLMIRNNRQDPSRT